jgi:hypothetical protein
MYSLIYILLNIIFLLSVLLIIIFFLLQICITEEDLYHSIYNKDDCEIVGKLYNCNSYENIIKDLQFFIDCYNKNNKNNQIQSHNSNCIFINTDKYNNLDKYHYKILLNPNDNSLKFVFKHKYIGGAYIRNLLLPCSNTTAIQLTDEKTYPHSSFINIFYFFKLLYNYNTIPKINGIILKKVNSNSEIQRYTNTYNIDRINNKYSSRIIIIFNILKIIQNALNIGRPLVCYLPIAFNHVYGVNNNIGIIFIELLENDTIDTFNKRFEQNKYQALATNFVLLNNLNKLSVYNGSSVRQNVDIVITSIYHNNNDTEKPAMVYWTYKNVAEYPIYVAISSCVMEEKIVVSQTITSNIGKINLPAYYKEIDCNYFTE